MELFVANGSELTRRAFLKQSAQVAITLPVAGALTNSPDEAVAEPAAGKKFQGLFGDNFLDSLGIKHGTDKSSKWHDYLRKYQFFLDPWRNDAFTCLELGVEKGYSLKMWKEFFPNAHIVGVDIDPAACSKVDGVMECVLGDLGKMDFLTSLQKYKPRLVVDDASHLWNHQLSAFFTLFPHVMPGGVYILEDTHTSFEPWATTYKTSEVANPFQVMQKLAEYLTAYEKISQKTVLPLSPPGPYQSQIEAIAKTVDCVAFIKSSCLIVKKNPVP